MQTPNTGHTPNKNPNFAIQALRGAGRGARGAGQIEAAGAAEGGREIIQRATRDGDSVARLARQFAAPSDESAAKLALCFAGGPHWGQGAAASHTAGCAAREARRLYGSTGVWSSNTAIDEAAGDAVPAIWEALCGWEAVCGRASLEQWANDRTFRTCLLRAGARAAYSSLRNRGGMTGEKADSTVSLSSLSHEDTLAAVESLQAHFHPPAGPREPDALELADADMENQRGQVRRKLSGWIRRALVAAPGRGAGPAQARRTGCARFIFLAGMIYGRDMEAAASRAGFASVGAALESLRAGKVWETLRQAAGPGWERIPGIQRRARQLRESGRAAGWHVKMFRRESDTLAAVALMEASRAPEKALAPAAALYQFRRARLALRVGARQTALELAQFRRGSLRRARAAQAKAWDEARKGWRKGWLRAGADA